MSRRVGGVALLSVLLVFAGCSGLFGGANSPGATTTDGPNGSMNGTMSTSYDFTEGESYTYDLQTEQGNLLMGWQVVSVDDDEVTVNLTIDTADEARGGTITAPADELISQTRGNVFGAVFLLVQLPIQIADGRELTVGNSWTVRGDQLAVAGQERAQFETATIEITGTDTVAGEECYTMDIRPDDQDRVTTACLRSDWPFALSMTTSEDTRSFEVVEFERP